MAIVRALAALYQSIFPERIRAVYLIGSRAEQSAATISDIDGVILFKDTFLDDSEKDLAQKIMAHCQLLSPIRLDMALFAEDDKRLTSGVDVRLKLSGHLIAGEDIRDRLPLPPVDAYQAYIRDWIVSFLIAIHDLDELKYPLTYPDANDEFFGYTRVRALAWYPHGTSAGTKELVSTICWVASALLAFEAEVFVPSRAECLRLSNLHLPVQWADFIQKSYQRCKVDWDYKVPNKYSERQELHQICQQALAFFNEYLGSYGNISRTLNGETNAN